MGKRRRPKPTPFLTAPSAKLVIAVAGLSPVQPIGAAGDGSSALQPVAVVVAVRIMVVVGIAADEEVVHEASIVEVVIVIVAIPSLPITAAVIARLPIAIVGKAIVGPARRSRPRVKSTSWCFRMKPERLREQPSPRTNWAKNSMTQTTLPTIASPTPRTCRVSLTDCVPLDSQSIPVFGSNPRVPNYQNPKIHFSLHRVRAMNERTDPYGTSTY
jgi:hypothetical protein